MSEIEFQSKDEITNNTRLLYSIIFIAGLIVVTPPFIPISLFCAAILLFQKKNRTFTFLGYFLIAVCLLTIFIYFGLIHHAHHLVDVSYQNNNL